MEKYPFQIRELSEDDGGGYLVAYPDLPGCMSDGDTIEEARHNASQALGDWLAARKKMGKAIPPPSPVVDLHEYSGKYMQRLPKSTHAQLARRAELEGISMNQLAATYIASGLAELQQGITSRAHSVKSSRALGRDTGPMKATKDGKWGVTGKSAKRVKARIKAIKLSRPGSVQIRPVARTRADQKETEWEVVKTGKKTTPRKPGGKSPQPSLKKRGPRTKV